MKTVKEILSENKSSVISSLKFVFKVYSAEAIKEKAIEFFAYASENAEVEKLNSSTRIKTELKNMVQKMSIAQKTEKKYAYNLKHFGTKTPGANQILSSLEELNGDAFRKYDHIRKEYV